METTKSNRLFYINDKLEFSLFYDPTIVDKDLIIKKFLDSKDWEFYKSIWEIKKVKKIDISDDLMVVRVLAG